MESFANKKDNILKTDFQNFHPRELETFTLEDVLVLMIKALNDDIELIRANLEGHQETCEHVVGLNEMLTQAETMVMHLEFILNVNNSSTSDEIHAIKEQFSAIKSSYEKLQLKEDLTPVPAKHVGAILVKVVIYELRRLIKSCFNKKSNGKVDLYRTDDNLAWIKILTARFRLFGEHYPMVVTFPKDDIFNFERSSPVWQDLYKCTIIKDTYSEDEVNESFRVLLSQVNVVRILYQNHKNYENRSYFKIAYSHLRDILYYGIQPAKAEAQARLHLVNPQVDVAFKPWRIAEHPFICFYMSMKSPSIAQDDMIYIPRLFPAITADLISKEYEENTINKVHPMNPADLIGPDVRDCKDEVLRELFIEGKNKIPVRILGPEDLNLQEGGQSSEPGLWKNLIERTIGMKSMRNSQPVQGGQAIVIHMHGGGFVALNSSTQKVYLSRWVKNLKLVHFSIDYRLAPDNMYPDALDDVWQAYLWIINYAKTVLGIEHEKVIIAGDSAGGNLALTLSLRLIRAGLKPPHGIALMYPAMSLNSNAFSPSYFLSLNDAMLPVSIIKLIVKAYIGEQFNTLEDPFLSPVVASDELLEKLPPVRIIAGSQDPLNDDNWRFVAKLRKLNKNVKFLLYENLPHGYLSHQDLKDFDIFVKETCDMVQELLALEA